MKKVKDQQIYDIFDQGGLLSSKLKTYEFREGQLSMALDVLHAYKNNSIFVIEAGTGIGKSFSYLVPALLYAFEDKEERTVIATSTINLQRQLLEKDIPTLFNVLGKSCTVALAVGRNNYLCLRRLREEVINNPLFANDGVSEISKLNHFGAVTETGLRSDYEGKLDYNLWLNVSSDADFCMGYRCPLFEQCFYFKAKKKLSEASIIICNHHLLFVDSSARYEEELGYEEEMFLPAFRHLVVDESHNMERHATSLFTNTYSSYALKRQIDNIYDNRGLKGIGSKKILDDLAPYCSEKDLYQSIVDFIALVRANSDTLNMATLNLLEYNNHTHLLVTRQNILRLIAEVGSASKEVIENASRLLAKLNAFLSKINTLEAPEHRVEELSTQITRVESIIFRLSNFFDYQNWNDDVYFLDIEKHGANKYVTFNRAPLEVKTVLSDALFKKIDSVICTSATLDLNDEFNYFSTSVGLPVEKKEFKKSIYISPFDYKNRLMLLTPFDTPTFSKDNEEEYASYICSTIYDAVSSSNGGALVLFTSIRLMEKLYEELKVRFSAINLNTLKQGDCDRYTLLEKFKKDKDSVLFATDSFWEGVDAPGDTLRLVIITKLPFRMPDDPIYKARYVKLEQEGKSGFYCLALPDATMKLKQGFGRLMRHTSDKGIVLILDSRIVSKGYGSLMQRSLPESYHPETETKSISQKIESFLF